MADDFVPGLEGVIAFETTIAEPDKDGGSLRYRGVDIEDLVGKVTFGNVWALLVDGKFGPGLPPAEPFPIPVHTGDVRVDVQAALAMLTPIWGYQPLLDINPEEAREELARAAVGLRWSSPWDLTDAIEGAGDDALFAAAAKGGSLERVEDELFRLERILDANGEAVGLLDEQTVDVARRTQLLDSLVARRVAAGLTQTEVAARMGTSQSSVARLEGGHADVRLSTLERYAAVVGARITHEETP